MKQFVYNVLDQLDLDSEDKHRIGVTTFANNVQVRMRDKQTGRIWNSDSGCLQTKEKQK